MILIMLEDYTYSSNIGVHVVPEDSRAAELAVELSRLTSTNYEMYEEFASLLDESTYLRKNLPCEVTGMYTVIDCS